MRDLVRATPAPLLLIETDAEAGGGFGLVPLALAAGAGGGAAAGRGGLSAGYLQQLYQSMGVGVGVGTGAAGAPTWVTPGLHPHSIGARLVALVVQYPTMRIVRLSGQRRGFFFYSSLLVSDMDAHSFTLSAFSPCA
jgi:hypothetical protein